MKTHAEFVRWLKNKYPELLNSWNEALKEFYYEEVEK